MRLRSATKVIQRAAEERQKKGITLAFPLGDVKIKGRKLGIPKRP